MVVRSPTRGSRRVNTQCAYLSIRRAGVDASRSKSRSHSNFRSVIAARSEHCCAILASTTQVRPALPLLASRSHVRALWNYRSFIYEGALYDLRNRYAGSSLGVFWNVLTPLVMLLLYALIFTVFIPTGSLRTGAGGGSS